MEKKTAIFGGSFNPVHKAHVGIIKNLAKRFDRVVIVPCYISPFKKSDTLANGAVRVKMLEACVKNVKNAEICLFELEAGETSYSVDTVRFLKEKYKNESFYFVIGSEEVKGLPRWKDIGELQGLVTFYAVERPGFAMDEKKLKSLAKKGIAVQTADFMGEEGSSAEAKAALAFGVAETIMPAPAVKIAQSEGLYAEFARLARALKEFNLSEQRTQHTYRAVQAGIVMAKRFKADVNKTVTALILHDIGKHAALCAADDAALKAELEGVPEKVRHAFTGAYIAKEKLKIKNKDIIAAIKTHTCGDEKMSKLQKIVFLADLTESGREFDGVEHLRELCGVNLNKAMEAALEITLAHLIETDSDIYYKTELAYDYFSALNAPKPKKVKAGAPVFGTIVPEQAAELKTEPKAEAAAAPQTPKALAELIAEILSSKKAHDVQLIDISQKTIIADYFVIASVTSTTAVRALSDLVDERLSKAYGIEPLRRDRDVRWMAVDYGSVILHVMHEETREFYNLERLWQDKK